MTTAPPPDAHAGGHPGPPDDAVPSEEELVARVAAGDRAAFQVLYERHAPAVMSFVHHLTFDRQIAEDAVQETFLKVWKGAWRFRPGSRFAPWLFRIARNTAWNSGSRRRLRAVGGDGEVAPCEAAGAAADALAGDAEAAAAAREAVLSLSEALRPAFVLVRMEGRSLEETAEILEVPLGTVKSRVAAAEAALRLRLGGAR